MSKLYGNLEVVGSTTVGVDLTVTGIINGAVTGTATNATNIAGGAANQIPFNTASGTTSFLAPSVGALVYTGSALVYSPTPTFASETLTSNTNQLVLGTTNTTTVTMASLTGSRILTLPDANSTTVIGTTATASEFLTNITTAGVQTKAQPAFTDISGTINTTTQITPALQSYTPTMGNGVTNFILSIANGKYTQIGKLTFFWIQVAWTSKNGATGIITIRLPTTSAASPPRSPFTIGYANGTVGSCLYSSHVGGTNTILFFDYFSGGSIAQLTDANFTGSGELQLSGSYYSA